MKRLLILCSLTLMTLLLLASLAGCQQQPQTAATPSLAIMVESNIVKAGSSFMVSGSNFKPGEKVWVHLEYRASDWRGVVEGCGEADEEGSIHALIPVPEDIVPGDYEVSIYIGKLYEKELIATLPIHIQTRANTFISILPLTAQKTTLQEASSIIGVTVPLPSYLPEGYEVREIYVEDSTVRLLISEKETEKRLVTHTDAAGTRQRYEFRCRMTMSISWFSEMGIPIRLPVKQVKINESTGFLQDRSDHNALWWNWYPNPGEPGMFELVISANKEIPEKELVEVAESVQ